MKKCFLYLLMVGGLGACIQSEPLNAEADIMACKILNAKGSPETNIKGNIIINNAQVLAQANPSIDLTKLALEVTLTEGANISPDPARVMDYSHPQKFTVTSEDGNWHKEYSVIIDTFDLPLRYDFEHYELNETGKYQVFFACRQKSGKSIVTGRVLSLLSKEISLNGSTGTGNGEGCSESASRTKG